MFNKSKFAQIIKNIKETYNSQEEFAKKSEIGRTYLSQYMNMKLDEPPKPKILQKLANASNNITNYGELMEVCGYTDNNVLYKSFLEDSLEETEEFYLEKLRSFDLSCQENEVYQDMCSIILNKINRNMSIEQIKFIVHDHFKDINFLSNPSKQRVIDKVLLYFEFNTKTNALRDKLLNINYPTQKTNQKNSHNNISLTNTLFYMCPLYNEILSEEPYWLDNNIKGRIVLDTSIYNINKKNDYFSIEVNENYTNFRNTYGHYIIFQKQNSAKDDDIILTIIENSKPCIRKYKKLSNTLVMLQPIDFTDVLEPLVIDITNTAMSILGTAIGYFGKMETR